MCTFYIKITFEHKVDIVVGFDKSGWLRVSVLSKIYSWCLTKQINKYVYNVYSLCKQKVKSFFGLRLTKNFGNCWSELVVFLREGALDWYINWRQVHITREDRYIDR